MFFVCSVIQLEQIYLCSLRLLQLGTIAKIRLRLILRLAIETFRAVSRAL